MPDPNDPDQNAVARDWHARGFGCDLWVDPPGQVWADFVHAVDELLMVLDGAVEIEIDGQRLQPRRGQEVFIPAGALHTVKNVGNTKSRWLYGYRRR